jgi:hypothetical protein
MELLTKYYEGQLLDADAAVLTMEADQFKTTKTTEAEVSDKLKPRKHLKPILQKLSDR